MQITTVSAPPRRRGFQDGPAQERDSENEGIITTFSAVDRAPNSTSRTACSKRRARPMCMDRRPVPAVGDQGRLARYRKVGNGRFEAAWPLPEQLIPEAGHELVTFA